MIKRVCVLVLLIVFVSTLLLTLTGCPVLFGSDEKDKKKRDKDQQQGGAATNDPPSELVAEAVNSSQIRIDWKDNSEEESGFVVQMSLEEGSGYNKVGEEGADAVSHTCSGLDPDTKYYFRVAATVAGSNTAFSDPVSATTQSVVGGTFTINDDAASASSTSVTLHITVTAEAEQMRFSNDESTWSSWEPVAATKAWTLTTGDGEKTVYGEFKSATDEVFERSDTIVLSTTGPTVLSFEINDDDTYTNSTSVTIGMSATDAAQMRFRDQGGTWDGWESYASTKSWTLPSGDGAKTVQAELKTASGGVTAVSDSIILDTTPPVVSYMRIDDGAAATNSTSVTLNSSVSGATQMRYRNGGGSWSSWESYDASTSWSLPGGDGTKTVEAEYRDAAGNSDTTQDTIVLDTAIPSLSYFRINNGAATTNSRGVSLNMSVSGASQMRFRNYGVSSWSSWESYDSSKGWTLTSGNGAKRVYAQFRDAGGNVRQAYDDIYLDTVGPSISSFRINAGAHYTRSRSVTLNMSVSGASQMRFRNHGSSTWSSWYSYASSRSWTLTAGDGRKYVYAQFRDSSNNISSVYDGIYLDSTAPSVSYFRINNGASSTRSPSVTLNMSVSGANTMRFRNYGSSTWSSWRSYSSSTSWTLTSGDQTKRV